MVRKIIKSDHAPEPIGPYSQAVAWQGLIFTSGQIAIDPATGKLSAGDVVAQTKLVIRNLQAILTAGGSSLENVLKTTIYLKDMSDFVRVNEVYAQYFGQSLPARSTVEVSRLPKDVLIEIDCIATST